jgi:hypothetical protein
MDRYSFADITWESFRYHIHGIASPKGVQYLPKKIKRARTTMRPIATFSPARRRGDGARPLKPA